MHFINPLIDEAHVQDHKLIFLGMTGSMNKITCLFPHNMNNTLASAAQW